MLILPRQARDKHRESTQNGTVFLQDGLPKLSLHVVLGFILAVLPVYQTLMTLLAPPEQRVYCQLWGCPDLLSPGEGGVGASALPQDDVSAAAADMRTAR
jgi:hypothetical protein